MPSEVPVGPEFATADDVVAAMAAAGITCEVLRRRPAAETAGSGLDCVAVMDGARVEHDVHVLNPQRFSRDEVGDSIAAGRGAPYHHTLVAAGNWYIRVLVPDYAPRVAKALGGVVLGPLPQGERGAAPDGVGARRPSIVK
ncbi:hypothetical protein [Streptomyces sp. NPDC051211]|uniref:hypothetical protein n=1 Tax=Streptomyces sp. NPDC051211 TaxID=3154643 RepID=UPI00344C0D92